MRHRVPTLHASRHGVVYKSSPGSSSNCKENEDECERQRDCRKPGSLMVFGTALGTQKKKLVSAFHELPDRFRPARGGSFRDESKNNGDDFGRCAARRADAPSRGVAPRIENDELLAY